MILNKIKRFKIQVKFMGYVQLMADFAVFITIFLPRD
jgi:hypothetical protein